MAKNRFIWSFFNWKISVQIPFLFFTCFAFVLCLNLANWQLQRAYLADDLFNEFQLQNQRPESALSDQLEAYQRITIEGDVKGHYFLDNKINQGTSGWHVLAEVQTDTYLVLVNLGWQAKQANLSLQTPLPEHIKVQGLVRKPSDGFMLQSAVEDPNWPTLMQQIDIPLLNQHIATPLFPFVLYAENKIGNLIPAPIEIENKYFMHIGYAIQWLLIGLAAIAVFLYISRIEYKENERKEKKLVA